MKDIVERKLRELERAKETIRKSYIARLETVSRTAMDSTQPECVGLPSTGFLMSHVDLLHDLRTEFNQLEYACQILRETLRAAHFTEQIGACPGD